LEGRSAATTLVTEVMTQQMHTVSSETPIDECMAIMLQYHIRHLPVVDEGTLVGIISMRDVVAAALAERESRIKGLEDIIQSSGFSR
jgi:CBS domain-containing protein